MENKQTAVQWLSSHWAKLQKDGEKMSWQQIIDITNLALQMEREQIEEAFNQGYRDAEVDYEVDIPKDNSWYQDAPFYNTQTFKP